MSRTDPLRVFAVEDEAMIAFELRDILEDLGHEVVGLTASIDQAVAALAALAEPPDVAVVDVNLGGTLAIPVVEALRARSVPVLLTTGYEASDIAGLGLEAPIIRKPYRLQDVAAALKALQLDRDKGGET